MEEFAKYSPLITIAVGVLTVVAVLIGVGRYTRGLEARLEVVERRLDALNAWASGFSKEVTAFFSVVIQLLNNRGQLNTDELGLVTTGLSGLSEPAIETLFDRERLSRNPLASDELDRLEAYYRRARKGEILNDVETDDYNRLVSVLEKDHPSDPGVYALTALGAFFTGLKRGRSVRRS